MTGEGQEGVGCPQVVGHSGSAVESAIDPVRAALAELVALKDGPRDEDYERRKSLAWQAARDALR